MAKTDIFFIPEAPVREQPAAGRSRKPAAGGIRLGLLDNSKGNADHLLRLLTAGLGAQLAIGSVTSLRKSSAAAGAQPNLLDQLAAETDFVVSAMAD
jgi:hypothetical protein